MTLQLRSAPVPVTKTADTTSTDTATLSWGRVVFFAAFHLLALLAPFCFSWSALGVALVLHWLCGSIGICLAYHRLLAHRSLQVPRWLEYVLVTIGALALQGGPIFWAAGHRRHHAHAEDPIKDPHASTRGFCWSHMFWLFYRQPAFFDRDRYRKSAKDLDRDPYYRWLDRYFIWPQVLLGVALWAIGGWSFVLYGIVVRSVVLWHCTWFVNSATHFWGYCNFESDDDARNLWWVGILAYGEGWHNNHHVFPHVAPAGLRWWEIDMTWWAIRGLEILGLTQKVVRPPLHSQAN